MEGTDRTFYCLSYLAFCLAIMIPFIWIIGRGWWQNRKNRKDSEL